METICGYVEFAEDMDAEIPRTGWMKGSKAGAQCGTLEIEKAPVEDYEEINAILLRVKLGFCIATPKRRQGERWLGL